MGWNGRSKEVEGAARAAEVAVAPRGGGGRRRRRRGRNWEPVHIQPPPAAVDGAVDSAPRLPRRPATELAAQLVAAAAQVLKPELPAALAPRRSKGLAARAAEALCASIDAAGKSAEAVEVLCKIVAALQQHAKNGSRLQQPQHARQQPLKQDRQSMPAHPLDGAQEDSQQPKEQRQSGNSRSPLVLSGSEVHQATKRRHGMDVTRRMLQPAWSACQSMGLL